MSTLVPTPCPVCAADLNTYGKPHCEICKTHAPHWRTCSFGTSKGFFRQLCGAVVDTRGRWFLNAARTEPKEPDVDPDA